MELLTLLVILFCPMDLDRVECTERTAEAVLEVEMEGGPLECMATGIIVASQFDVPHTWPKIMCTPIKQDDGRVG